MVENTPFKDEWDTLQKTFWESVDSNYARFSTTDSNTTQTLLFDKWINEVDKCWERHAQECPGDIDSLYKKISSSSRFLFNFTETMATRLQQDTSEDLIQYFQQLINESTAVNAESAQEQEMHADFNAFWMLPLQQWQKQAEIFAGMNQSFQHKPTLADDTAQDTELSSAFESYLIALQKYLQLFLNLFNTAVKQAVEIIRDESENPVSPKKIMSIWLEVLEAHYLKMISANLYAESYAELINRWFLVLNNLNKPYSEYMQQSWTSSQAEINE